MEEKEPNNNFKNTPEYQKITDKFFYASLVNIPLFAVPAFSALFLGKFLDKKFGTDKMITLGLLLLSAVISWVLVLRNNKKINKEYREIRKGMEDKESKN
jgi:uncharacterized membrane protein (DUF485 family)